MPSVSSSNSASAASFELPRPGSFAIRGVGPWRLIFGLVTSPTVGGMSSFEATTSTGGGGAGGGAALPAPEPAEPAAFGAPVAGALESSGPAYHAAGTSLLS